MENMKFYNKYLCPVSGFFNGIFENRPELTHDPIKREISFNCEYFDLNANYYFLGEDITISYQNIRTTKHLFSKLQTKDSQKFYIITILDNPETELAITFNNKKQLVDGSSVLFYNNYCDYTILEKDDFKRSYLQIILTENYIKNYINPKIVEKSLLEDIISHDSEKLLVVNQTNLLINKDIKNLMRLLNSGKLEEKAQLKILKIITSFLESFFKYQITKDSEGGLQQKLERESKADEIINILQGNITKPFMGIPALSQLTYMSPSSINRFFQKKFKMTPFQYFKKEQVKCAKRLLLNCEMSVSEVAFHFGYEQSASFIRVFKDFTGYTPGAYRIHFLESNQFKSSKYI